MMKRLIKEKIVEISSVIVALCALYVAVHQSASTNYHNRLSTLPVLQIVGDLHGAQTLSIEILNSGTGLGKGQICLLIIKNMIYSPLCPAH